MSIGRDVNGGRGDVRGDVVSGRDGVTPVALLDGVRAGARRGEGSCRHKCTSVMVFTDIRTTGYVLRAMKGTATKAATTERANMIAS